MKTNFKSLRLAAVLLFLSNLAFSWNNSKMPSNGSVSDIIDSLNNVNNETIPPKDIAVVSVLENAAIKYNAAAFIKDNEVYFRLYRGRSNGIIQLDNREYLIERKISAMRNDSYEDRLLTLELRRRYPTLPRNMNVNITRQDTAFKYSRPVIVYNYKSRSFLVLCLQQSEEYGQQIVGRLFKCCELGNNRYKVNYIWDEFRILNKVILLKGRYNSFSVRRESIKNFDIDTGDRFAVLAITKRRAAEVRLVYMDCRFANYLYSNIYIEPREAGWRGFSNVSAAIEEIPDTRDKKIYILYSYRRSNWHGFVLDVIDNDFTNFYNRRIQHEIPLQSGYVLSGEDRPKIISAPYVDTGRYGLRNDADRPHKLLILYTYQYRDRDGIIVYDVYSEIPIADVVPRNTGNCKRVYKPRLETNGHECFLVFQGNYKVTLDGEDINFNYVFGKKVHLYRDEGQEISEYFLISGGRPMPRESLGVSATGISYYAGNGWIGVRGMPIGPLISINLDYIGFTGETAHDNRSIDLDWNYDPLSFKLYILRSDSEIEKKNIEDNRYKWANADYSELEDKESAVLLIYEGTYRNVDNGLFMPQASDPLKFNVSPKPRPMTDDDYGSAIPEVAGIDY